MKSILPRLAAHFLIPASLAFRAESQEPSFHDPAHWSSPFYPQGISEPVLDLHIQGDSLYAAGILGRADSVKTWGLALWNGREWSSPGGKPPFDIHWVSQIHKSGERIYLCGALADGKTDSSILAWWNGRDWESRILPFQEITVSMAAWGDTLVLASFTKGLWRVENSQVVPLQPRIEGVIQEVAAQGGGLWVRGANLKIPGDTSACGLAYLEGGVWNAPGPFRSRAGLGWAWLGQEVFVIGGRTQYHPNFDPADLWRWNGAAWSQVALDQPGRAEIFPRPGHPGRSRGRAPDSRRKLPGDRGVAGGQSGRLGREGLDRLYPENQPRIVDARHCGRFLRR